MHLSYCFAQLCFFEVMDAHSLCSHANVWDGHMYSLCYNCDNYGDFFYFRPLRGVGRTPLSMVLDFDFVVLFLNCSNFSVVFCEIKAL